MSMISKLAKYGNMKLYCTGYKVVKRKYFFFFSTFIISTSYWENWGSVIYSQSMAQKTEAVTIQQ